MELLSDPEIGPDFVPRDAVPALQLLLCAHLPGGGIGRSENASVLHFVSLSIKESEVVRRTGRKTRGFEAGAVTWWHFA